VTIAFTAVGIAHNTICLTDYHPYRIMNEDGEKIKNPKFGIECGQLLDIKGDPAGRNYRAAVSAFGNRLAKALKDDSQLARYASVDIAIIPKSEAGKVAPGLLAVAERLEVLDKRFILPRSPILTRVKSIEKLANGGNRAMYVHTGSIVADIPISRRGRAILLIDDIGTTGNSIMACTTLLYGAGASRVFPIVLGRTT
jgi:adenine/guanine phosphoribosyltransferase-like PRPP-binding protein